jgi:hypothetical protein
MAVAFSKGMYKKDYTTLVEKQLDKWPANQDGVGTFNAKTPIRIIKNVLLDPKHGFTTNLPRRDAPATLSKSKTAASQTLTYQKELAVDQAKRDGSVKSSALAERLESAGVQAAAVSVSKVHTYLVFCF